jgi:hypothetical protein
MTVARSVTRIAGAVRLTALMMLSACGSSTGPLAPFQPQINNAPDNFQFQATGVTNVTYTFTYTWSNSGTSASVNQSTTATGGTATVTILDANGVQVYTQDLTANGTFATSAGATGNWTIKVVFTNYSGTPNFRAQKV